MSEAEMSEGHDPLKTMADALDAAVQAAKEGAHDAREAAEGMMPEAGTMSRLVYNACYGLSYGVVFPSVLLARSIPRDNAFFHGMVDGAHAAKDMVTTYKTKKEGEEGPMGV